MLRFVSLALIATLALAACSDSSRSTGRSASNEVVVGGTSAPASVAALQANRALPAPPPPGPGQPPDIKPKLAYSHSMSLEMAAANVQPRYDRARNACLSDASLNCILVHASIERGDPNTGAPPYANMTVRVPHDKVAVFQNQLLSPLKDEPKGEPIIRQSTTDAEDLTYVILDGERRLKQAEDYRDRLTELAKNNQAKVEDLIQIQEKLSEVQARIEQYTSDQRQLNQRVDTEILSINLSALATIANVQSPLARAWRNAGDVLGNSAAEAFTFTVSTLPWLPLMALLLWLALRLLRIVRGRRTARKEPAPVP